MQDAPGHFYLTVMNSETLQSEWAAWLAIGALVVAIIVLVPKFLKTTSRSKLNRVLADMKAARKEFGKIMRETQKAEKKVEKLLARADRVKPRVLQEAKDAYEDVAQPARPWSLNEIFPTRKQRTISKTTPSRRMHMKAH